MKDQVIVDGVHGCRVRHEQTQVAQTGGGQDERMRSVLEAVYFCVGPSSLRVSIFRTVKYAPANASGLP